MKRITWGENLTLSVPEMDQEHAGLISLADEFIAAVHAEASRAELEVRLTQLIAAFAAHFQGEEESMRSGNFPGLTAHASEHSRLIAQMSELRDDLASGSVNVCAALAVFVRLWTEQHIQGPDAVFAQFLKREDARRAAGA
jgi:hemerythrin